MNVSLAQCVHALEDEWVEEHREGAHSGVVESQMVYAQVIDIQMLLTGAGSLKRNHNHALHYLKLASKRSAEACLKLGKLYMKGGKVAQDLGKAYFYLRVATLFKCKCGSFAESYHNKSVSSPYLCCPTESWDYLKALPQTPAFEENFRDQFNVWRRS